MRTILIELLLLVLTSGSVSSSPALAQGNDEETDKSLIHWYEDPQFMEQILKALPANARAASDGSWTQTACAVANTWAERRDFVGRRIRFRIPVTPVVEPDSDHPNCFRITAFTQLILLQNTDFGSVLYSEVGYDGGPQFATVGFVAEAVDAEASEQLERSLVERGLLLDGTVKELRFTMSEKIQLLATDVSGEDEDAPNGMQGLLALGMLAMVIPADQLAGMTYPLVQVVFDASEDGRLTKLVSSDLGLGLGKLVLEESLQTYAPFSPNGIFPNDFGKAKASPFQAPGKK
ncbi:MAG: hypothetical protein IPG61_16105 [bacterium]|nr:hypothetical protein [bacterium]